MTLARVVAEAVAWVRGVTGMPDYTAYLRHMEGAHPDRLPLTREQHFSEHIERRYRGVSRCC